MNRLFVIVAVIYLLSCNQERSFDHSYFEMGVSQGTLDNSQIDEASGLAASERNKGMFWTHNDSGGEADIFLIDDKGSHRATVHLQGIVNRDWEDIAVAPGPEEGKSYIYIGDIGDNGAVFKNKYIYRIEEPAISFAGDEVSEITVDDIDQIVFQLPGQPRDTEALMVDPQTKDIFILSKREKERVNLYMLPYPQPVTDVFTAHFVMHVAVTGVTAGDISNAGNEVLIKSYKNVYYWRRETGESLEELFGKAPAKLPYKQEPQGEAIAFDRTGEGYYTLSEEGSKKKAHLIFYKRKEQAR